MLGLGFGSYLSDVNNNFCVEDLLLDMLIEVSSIARIITPAVRLEVLLAGQTIVARLP